MKSGKLVTTLLLALWCILFVNACGLFGDAGTPTASTTPPVMTVAEAETRLRQAEANLKRLQASTEASKASPDEIQQLQATASQLRQKATLARQKADTMREQSRSKGRDPDSKKDAPNTYEATQKANDAAAQAAEAQDKLEEAKSRGVVSADDIARANDAVAQAKKDLEAAKQTGAGATISPAVSQATPSVPPSEPSIILTTLVPLLLMTTLLIVIVLLYRRISQRLKGLELGLRDGISGLKYSQDTVAGKLASLIENGKLGSPEISALRKKFETFERALDEIPTLVRQELESGNQARIRNTGTEDGEGKIVFPMPAEDYLSRMKGKLRYVKHDYPNQMLIEDSENGDIALVTDSAPRGMAYAVPKLNRFPTKQEYYTIYEKYFECNSPYSGFVVIVKPALVEAVDGGWKLRDRGQLRVGG